MPTLKYKDPVTGEYKADIHVVGAVSSVNGKTGVVELTTSDIPNAITDVQINGTSVVVDGVASIPVASQTSIDARSIGRVLQCSDIPYAVKSAMISTTDPAWTATEQAAARERMNADGGAYELIASLTLDGSARSAYIDKDKNNNPISTRHAIAIITCPIKPASNIYTKTNLGTTGNFVYATPTNDRLISQFKYDISRGGCYKVLGYSAGLNQVNTTVCHKPVEIVSDTIKEFTISFNSANAPEGTTIEIYAR